MVLRKCGLKYLFAFMLFKIFIVSFYCSYMNFKYYNIWGFNIQQQGKMRKENSSKPFYILYIKYVDFTKLLSKICF